MSEKLQTIARGKEKKASPEQHQFYEAWQREAARAYEAEKAANQYARDRMKGLTAPELRKIGAKQVAWGLGLSVLNGVGGALGWLGGVGVTLGTGALAAHATAGTLIGTALNIAAIGSIAAPFVGAAVGVVAGAELAGYVYDKVVRKLDKQLPALDKTDKVVGGALALVGTWTPPMIAGIRNLFDGYNNMKSIQ